jgi:LTXXQ motif family protein
MKFDKIEVMDIFAQKKMLISSVVILIVINLVSISFFLWRDSQNKRNESIPNENNALEVNTILKEKLQLTEFQTRQLTALRLNFYRKEKVLSKIIRAERDSMNAIMFNKDTDEKLIIALAKRVSENEYKMEIFRFEQAVLLKRICTDEQILEFENLVKEIRDYFKPINKNKK